MNQTRTIELPSDSHFAVAMKNQKEAERAEQQRIKNLVLNYDLQDSNADQDGTDNDLYYNRFIQPNPNIPRLITHFQSLAAAHASDEGLGERHPASHQYNASLHQSSSSNNAGNVRPADKSGTNRSGQRARKLQLSDVDWYEQKPGSSRSRGRGGTRGSRRMPG